jgi:hypothetical protein
MKISLLAVRMMLPCAGIMCSALRRCEPKPVGRFTVSSLLKPAGP